MTKTKYHCTYCDSRFVSETRFIKHKCKQMIREEEFKTPVGQAAWIYYQKWMKAYRRTVQTSSSFLHSKFYTSFIKFATFKQQAHLPDVDMFIWLMKDKDISPTIWTNDQVYVLYMEFMDRKASPVKHAEITINTLFDVSNEHDCDVSSIFDVLSPNEVIQLLRQRRLSPWILLNSSKFKQFFIHQLSAEERIVMESIIRPPYWSKKFVSSPDDVKRMKLYVAELSL